jgi:uncharacterized protein (TIGR04255 family)
MAAKYSKAPISEVVCGIIFNSNLLLNNSVLFKLLIRLQDDFPNIQTHPTINEDEVVNGIIQSIPDYLKAGFSTYRVISADGKWQVLVQQNLITLNWVRQDAENVGNYPGFQTVFDKFKQIYTITKQVLGDDQKFQSSIKYYYLAYSDRVNVEEFKGSENPIMEITTLQPPTFQVNNKEYKANNFFNRYSVQCDAIDGFSIITVNSPTMAGYGQILMVENKVKGAPAKYSVIDDWFEVAHKIHVSFFETFFSKKILDQWT